MNHINSVLDFWFREIDTAAWWKKDAAFDQLIRERFNALHHVAIAGELYAWRSTPQGRLAEIILIDQFSRNIFRDQPASFQHDVVALVLCQEAIQSGADQTLSPSEKAFLYLPLMHSESPVIHQQALVQFNQPGLENNLAFELKHKAIIDVFGRYPHRNIILGRVSTPEEIEFLQQPGSSF